MLSTSLSKSARTKDIRHTMRWFQTGEKVDMVLHPSNLERGASELSQTSAEIFVERGSAFLNDQAHPIFR